MGSLAEWLQKRSILRTSDDLIAEPIPVRIVEATDSAAAGHLLVDTSGRVTEASAATISATATSIKSYSGYITSGQIYSASAGGTFQGYASTAGWKGIAPVSVTADGAGAVADTEIVGATASRFNDIELYFQADTTGSYLMDLAEDESGTASNTVPDWHASPPTFSMVAGQRYGPFHLSTPTDNKTFGVDVMANGSWPNGAIVTFYGNYRTL